MTEHLLRLALEKKDGEPLSDEDIAIREEYASGRALEYTKVERGDPELLEKFFLYKRWQNKTAQVIEDFKKHLNNKID